MTIAVDLGCKATKQTNKIRKTNLDTPVQGCGNSKVFNLFRDK